MRILAERHPASERKVSSLLFNSIHCQAVRSHELDRASKLNLRDLKTCLMEVQLADTIASNEVSVPRGFWRRLGDLHHIRAEVGHRT